MAHTYLKIQITQKIASIKQAVRDFNKGRMSADTFHEFLASQPKKALQMCSNELVTTK